MSAEAYRVLLWERQQRQYLADFIVPPARELYLGRHSDNAVRIDHPQLALFHFVFWAQQDALEILTLPGAPALLQQARWPRFCERIRVFIGGTLPHTRKIHSVSHFHCGSLALDIVPPRQIFWPRKATAAKSRMRSNRLAITFFALLIAGSLLGRISMKPAPQAVAPRPEPALAPETFATPFPIQIPTTAFDVHQPSPRRKSATRTLVSPLEQAKSLFRDGREVEAVQLLLHTFASQGARPIGKRSAELAKNLREIQAGRQSLLTTTEFSPTEAQRLSSFEKLILGQISEQTRRLLRAALHAAIDRAQNLGSYQRALDCLTLAGQLLPGDSDLTADRERLEAQGAALLDAAQALRSLNPDRARLLLEQSLRRLPPESPTRARVRDLLAIPRPL